MKRALIGIDPGKKTGVAIKRPGQPLELFTTDFWGAIDLILTVHTQCWANDLSLLVVVENPNGNLPTFEKKSDDGNRVREKISQDVGKNKAEARLILEYCVRNGIKSRSVTPTKGQRKGKITAEDFKTFTGYKGKSSQHARDAGMLITGL